VTKVTGEGHQANQVPCSNICLMSHRVIIGHRQQEATIVAGMSLNQMFVALPFIYRVAQ